MNGRRLGLRGLFRERERTWLVFLLLFALIFMRCCYYGFTYYPQLDDYIQLHNQAAYYTFSQVVLDMGLLSSRPLASVMDMLFWSRLWGVMILGVLLISALYAASACLFRRVWQRYFGTGYVFLALYALLPLGMEGTYWMSASTRVVPALFFTALAMWLFQRWCAVGRWWRLALYFVVQLLSFCFYEQGLVLSVTGVLLVGILEFRDRRARASGALLTFVNAGIYFAFTSAFSLTTGQLGSRLKLAFPWQEGYVSQVFRPAAGQVGSAFAVGGFKTLFRGFRRGLDCLFSDFNLLWLLVLPALCALFFFCAARFTEEGRRPAAALVVGFLMALAPVTLFFVLADPFFALRSTVFSFCGLALMADALFGLLFHRAGARGWIAGTLCALFALTAVISSVSELHDYRDTYLADQRAATAIRAALDDGAGLRGDEKVGVIGLQPDYLPEQNFRHHEHIHGATESTWALTGLLTCESDNQYFPYCTPLPTGQEDLTGYDILLVYDAASGTASHYSPGNE